MKEFFTAALGMIFATSVRAAGIELRPDISPNGTMQMGFQCQYDSRDKLAFFWLIKTSQRLPRFPASLWWSAYDTSTGRYYLPWKHFELARQTAPASTTLVIESHDENEVRQVLLRLAVTEIHFSLDGSGDGIFNAKSVGYVFPLGKYRANAVDYFYDLTNPSQHCEVNEFQLPRKS